jgi:hypothetical protein
MIRPDPSLRPLRGLDLLGHHNLDGDVRHHLPNFRSRDFEQLDVFVRLVKGAVR